MYRIAPNKQRIELGDLACKYKLHEFDLSIVENLLMGNNLSQNLINELIKKPGHYLEINKNCEIVNDFETFDEYIEHINQI